MFGQAFGEQILGKDSALGQTIHASLDFNINAPVVHFFHEIVFVNDFLGNERDGEEHIFVSGHWCAEVKISDVDAHEFGVAGGDSAVEKSFGAGEIGDFGTDIAWIVNEIAATCQSGAIHFRLVGFDVRDDLAVGWSAIFGHLMIVNEENGVGALNAAPNTLGQSSKFVCKGTGPNDTEIVSCYKIAVCEDFAGLVIDDVIGHHWLDDLGLELIPFMGQESSKGSGCPVGGTEV